MRPQAFLTLGLVFVTLGALSVPARADSGREHLRIRNDFRTPEEVIHYYCARDASGFVWTGLLDAERAAFTLWNQSPQQDSFYVAHDYKIQPAHVSGNEASVEVTYDLAGMGDAQGTRVPAAVFGVPKTRTVQFVLRRENGVWRIAKPDPGSLSPVIVEGKLPYVSLH
jgi:hypothetical protein